MLSTTKDIYSSQSNNITNIDSNTFSLEYYLIFMLTLQLTVRNKTGNKYLVVVQRFNGGKKINLAAEYSNCVYAL